MKGYWPLPFANMFIVNGFYRLPPLVLAIEPDAPATDMLHNHPDGSLQTTLESRKDPCIQRSARIQG